MIALKAALSHCDEPAGGGLADSLDRHVDLEPIEVIETPVGR